MLPTHRQPHTLNNHNYLVYSAKFYLSRLSLSKYLCIFLFFAAAAFWYIVPPLQHRTIPLDTWSTRAEHVKDAYRHAWSGYFSLASPADELLPLTGGSVNKCVCTPLSYLSLIYP